MRHSENSAQLGTRRRRAAARAAGGLAALLAFAPAAFADNPPAAIDVGHSAYVLNTVNGQPPQARPVVIRLNDKIVFQEEVAAGHQAKTTIEFRDGSLFSLGPDAKARIDSFVFDPQRSTSHKTLAVTRGVFRYLSGFAVRDKEAKIEMPSGTLGIRGSLVIGIVTDGAPDFIFVAQGKAVFVNDAGAVEVNAGEAIAILSRHSRPIDPKVMPPAVAAQVLRAILKMLPSAKGLLAKEANAQLLLAEGKANLLSGKLQEKLEQLSRRHGGHGTAHGGGSLAAELPLLVEAAKLGLFNGKHGGRSAAEIVFVAKLGRDKQGAEAFLRGLVKEAIALHHDNQERALRVVGHGIGLAALIAAQTDPAATARLLQKAINALRINTNAAGHLVSLFADAIADTASCDPDEAKKLAKGLRRVLRNPRNRDLLAFAPDGIEDQVTGFAGPGTGPPPGPSNNNSPGPAPGAFGSFGSSAGSGVSTSPAS